MKADFRDFTQKRSGSPHPQKPMRPNSLRTAQVMPPFQVDLTLSPGTYEDVHVPANIAGTVALKNPKGDLRRM